PGRPARELRVNPRFQSIHGEGGVQRENESGAIRPGQFLGHGLVREDVRVGIGAAEEVDGGRLLHHVHDDAPGQLCQDGVPITRQSMGERAAPFGGAWKGRGSTEKAGAPNVRTSSSGGSAASFGGSYRIAGRLPSCLKWTLTTGSI